MGGNYVKQKHRLDRLYFDHRIIDSSHKLYVYNYIVGWNYVKGIHSVDRLFLVEESWIVHIEYMYTSNSWLELYADRPYFSETIINSLHRLHVYIK